MRCEKFLQSLDILVVDVLNLIFFEIILFHTCSEESELEWDVVGVNNFFRIINSVNRRSGLVLSLGGRNSCRGSA